MLYSIAEYFFKKRKPIGGNECFKMKYGKYDVDSDAKDSKSREQETRMLLELVRKELAINYINSEEEFSFDKYRRCTSSIFKKIDDFLQDSYFYIELFVK